MKYQLKNKRTLIIWIIMIIFISFIVYILLDSVAPQSMALLFTAIIFMGLVINCIYQINTELLLKEKTIKLKTLFQIKEIQISSIKYITLKMIPISRSSYSYKVLFLYNNKNQLMEFTPSLIIQNDHNDPYYFFKTLIEINPNIKISNSLIRIFRLNDWKDIPLSLETPEKIQYIHFLSAVWFFILIAILLMLFTLYLNAILF